ncbi:MAG: helix-turn-helix transcriptional regulator [Tenuifilum sp.]|uniref:helix-turn-helix domain-containing protein n=1 Tax=Tenuifilum sp. TaxID=2760880 RepID=UPI0016BA6C01|nr:helix-turn-helix transcriptional regulator [Bacteroidales bacterium]NLH46364.1 helix-turn-helix transcriptional regulator [Acholeplasmataceae bacterium]HOK60826.1 helix-turn-helix transcriptional regulator [Tenuifilum sp.]MBP9029002.1 helix-turn-helix transcriptional regulator [Bacteroidales bacterium]HOK86262.1 helix-turn-helix transcriptional regulator [Tenuifilum sp.]
MRSKTVDRLLKSTPKDVEIFVDWYADLVVRINQLLREKNISKKELSVKMNKKPSEISKWLNGEHNFTLRSLAKLSAELGVPLIEVTKKKVQTEFVEDGFVCRVHTFVSYTKLNTKTTENVWQCAEETEPYNELSNAG